MRSSGVITEAEALTGMAEPAPEPADPAIRTPEVGPAFLRLVRSQLDLQLSRARIERGGIRIMTTLDFELQQQAACTALTFSSRLAGAGDPGTGCAGADRLPALPPGTELAAPSASAVILDPQTGQVLAAVGETAGGAETTTLNVHHPGTLTYPFIYLAAFTRGFSPGSLVWDMPPGDEAPLPDARYLGPVRMRIALANDLETPAQGLENQMGPEAIERTTASFSLRSEHATALDVAGAYGILAAGGVRYGHPGPTTILRVEGLDGSVWLDLSAPEVQAVLSPPVAFVMNNVLADESARAVSLGAVNPLDLERPAAVKTGRTESGTDSWVVGYTPSRVTAVWVGTPERGSDLGRSPRIAGSLWNALMNLATQNQPPDGWLVPAGVTAVDVCDPSGMLPTTDCPSVVSEIFLNGNEPSQADTLFRRLAVNRETGLLATVFTPSELV
jgi:membrane peptidoglycan carboxypeptidase